MHTINLNGDIQQQLLVGGLAYPKRKASGKYGLPSSTLLDRQTELASLKAYLAYLNERRVINLEGDL